MYMQAGLQTFMRECTCLHLCASRGGWGGLLSQFSRKQVPPFSPGKVKWRECVPKLVTQKERARRTNASESPKRLSLSPLPCAVAE